MKCKKCGAEVSEQSSFCAICGHDLRDIDDLDYSEKQEFTQKIDICKNTKVFHKFMEKFSKNINSAKIKLSKKTKELRKSMKKLMKKFTENIHLIRIQLSKKTNELHRQIKKIVKNINSNSLVIIDGSTCVTEDNYTYVRGSVKNIGNRTIKYFEVNVKYEDVNKNVLDSDFTNWNRKVQSGESKEFEIKHHINKNYQSIKISINNNKFFFKK
ncbi:FxLYD domain-containing protein [Clostridium psychrophilum]|uniref:FxLYD domain-containing protein n=1 Tax=Clostridium psychrophilum TaxID=132926 RepID=UPI001C0E52CA|nr:FxLYD domain-containing protein [Clostridium psychrophilum]MBU3182381.1 zinc ribbon domain-containing protein [Clostridium psychrophilum]